MKNIFYTLLVIFTLSCSNDTSINTQVINTSEVKLFEVLPSSATGIEFSNIITESPKFNYIQYDVIFNGGGVALADFNNDDLVDIYFTGNQVRDALYLNKGNMQFEDISVASGIAQNELWSSSVSIGDVNGDGFLDIYVCKYLLPNENSRKNVLYINNGDMTFEDKAEEYGVADMGYSTSATFFDMDEDGDLDLYVGNQMPSSRYLKRQSAGVNYAYTDNLYRNDSNGKFTTVTEAAGVKNFAAALSTTASDLNGDGLVDIYVANDYEEPDLFYVNRGDGTFANVAHISLKHMSNFSMGVDLADFNNDGDIDLFSSDMVASDNYRSKTNMSGMNPAKFWRLVNAGYHHQYMFNALQLNNGNGSFSEIAQMAGVSNTDWSWTALFADLDLDGNKDLVVTNGLFRDVRNKDYIHEIEDLVAQHNKNAGSLSKDELNQSVYELAIAAPSQRLENSAFKNNGDLTFKKIASTWNLNFAGWTQGAAYADLDNDGDMDLVMNHMNNKSQIYKNVAQDQKINNYLKVYATKNNLPCDAARVEIKYDNNTTQLIEITRTRGFLSASEPVALFGLGINGKVDKLTVTYPDGKQVIQSDINANQTIKIDYTQASALASNENKLGLFSDITSSKMFPVSHNENEFDDYEREILIPHKMSTLGPVMATADVDGNGTLDIYFGGSATSSGVLFPMTTNGSYIAPVSGSEFSIDAQSEDLGATFFDVDGDGDQDLYVVSGGNEYEDGSKNYQDRLYINDGTGIFKKDKSFQALSISGSAVAAADYDGDGDIDVFASGRQIPGFYGYDASSSLYLNEGGKLKLDVNTSKLFNEIGMVTDAVWTDYDQDKDLDLLLVGEWMPLTIYNNDGGKLSKYDGDETWKNTSGWWNKITVADLDGDGDDDYIVGNLGLNLKYKASKEEPFKLFTKDFDGNGTHDVYLGYYDQDGTLYPVRGRQCSSQQMPFIKEKFEDYEAFAVASIEDILDDKMEGAALKEVQMFESVWIENQGAGKLKIHKLPNKAQIAPIYTIIPTDFDNDEDIDLFVAGNYHNREVETTRSDAGTGLILRNDGKGNFTPLSTIESGIYASLDARDAVLVEAGPDKRKVIIVANNNGPAQVFGLN
ncbi:MAG: VCBS repeat-containing protein [Saprospiraceae bacterium]|nr:VCBS repeat-containing protein [Saprospiraceae bacterium]